MRFARATSCTILTFSALATLNPAWGGAQTPEPRVASEGPIVDHHQHLQSAARARIANGPPELPAVALPPELADLVRRRGTHWNDPVKLAELYTSQPLLLVNMGIKAGYASTPAAAAMYLTTRIGGAYQLTPVAFQQGGSIAAITGYYTGTAGPTPVNFGFFHLQLQKQPTGDWKIAAEIPSFRDQPEEKVIAAQEMIAMLDAAGIKRAVILSGGFGIGSRADLAGIGEPAAVRYPKVQAENDWTAAQVAQFPDRLVAFCSFSPLEGFALIELERCANSGRFRGFKLHFDESRVDLRKPDHVEKVKAVMAAANRHRMPLVVHVGNNAGSADQNQAAVGTFLAMIAASAPDITVQVAHLWGGQGFSQTALDAYAGAMAAKVPGTRNLYFDMSESALIASHYGSRRPAILQSIADAIRKIGLDRILYGSDTARKYQHLQPRDAWAQFRADVPLTASEFDIIARNVAPYLR